MVKKYRKRPIVVEVVKWDGDNFDELKEFMDKRAHTLFYDTSVMGGKEQLVIETLEGVMEVGLGDYVIKGVAGEFYPCKPDIFEKTYEEVG